MATRTCLLCAMLAAALVSGCGGSGTPAPRTGRAERSGAVFTLTSEAYGDGGRIPVEYASERSGGRNRSIPFAWSGAPEETQSFALAIIDQAPVAREWVHWAVVDIPKETTSLPAGASGTNAMPASSREARNTAGAAGYGGPAPPPGSGEHPYVATLYALSVPRLGLPAKPTREDIDRAVAGKVLDTAELTGIYSR